MGLPCRIVVIGAGSYSFGLGLLRDLFASEVLKGSTLALVDTNAASLDRITELARRMNNARGAGFTIESTSDRREVLNGADFVLNCAAIERNRLWRMDFEIPRKYGIRHTLGENGGPGGLFFTMRTLPLVFDLARDVEELSPDALLINLSNPESRIVLALAKYTRVRAIGLCHGLFMSRADVAKVLKLPERSVEVLGAGLNHVQWLLQVQDARTGGDLYPRLRLAEAAHDPAFRPLTRQLFRAFGLWPTCSDGHLGEYFAFGWEAGEDGYDFAADERARAELSHAVEAVLAGAAIPRDWERPSGEQAISIMEAVAGNDRRVIPSGIIRNDGAILNLPADLAVEVPVVADGAGVHPVAVGPLPDPIAKLLSMPAHVHQLAVDAAVTASRKLALQALLIDPVVTSTKAAEILLDELWTVNQAYIRRCL